MHIAAEKGHKEVVHLLLANKADVSSTNKVGETPYDVAKTEEIKKLLSASLHEAAKLGNTIDNKTGVND